MSSQALSSLLNRQEPAAGRVRPGTTRPEPRSRVHCPQREHTPHRRLPPTLSSGSGGESCRARWTARRLRLGLREVPQDRVHNIVVDDECDDLHLALTLRVLRSIMLYLIDESLKERYLVFGRC